MSRAIAALALLFLAAGPAAALERVTLQLNWKHQFQFAGYYAAIERGYYRDAGLAVALAEVEPGRDPIDAVLAGRAQFGVGASELALRRARGEPLVALAAIIQHSPLVLLARRDAVAGGLHDLAGQRVMLMPHETELFAYLRRQGLGEDALEVMPQSFDTRDLTAGRVAAMSGYQTDEPFVLEEAGLPFAMFTPRTAGIDFYGDTLFATEAMVRDKPALVAAFRAASLRGWRYAMDHPAEIADLILAKYSRRHSRPHLLYEAAELARLMQPDLVDIGQMSAARWQHVADTYVELGMLPKGAKLGDFLFEAGERALPGWILPAFLAAGILLALMAGIAVRFIRLTRQLRAESRARQQLLHELHATERDMAALIDATPGAALLFDRAGTVLSTNGVGAARFGFSKSEILGRNIFELSPVDIRLKRHQAVEQAAAERRPVAIEDQRAGRRLHNTIVPVEDEDGEVHRIAVFSEDVTERLAAEEALRSANDELKDRLAELHELKERLAEAAIRDGLTGLYNRRYLDETLERELARARREGYPLSLVMLDIDHFKRINDEHGHLAGDEVLRAWSARLRADVRAEDVPCRYGGEEFLVLLPKMPLAAAAERAEAWRAAFAGLAVPFGAATLRCTASFGVAGFPEHGDAPDRLTQSADQALYLAKRGGRNRVTAFAAESQVEEENHEA